MQDKWTLRRHNMIDDKYIDTEIKRGNCGICNAFCGIEAVVKDNKIIEVRGDKLHPLTKGFICIKGKSLPDIVHSPDRIVQPLKKDKDGNWESISYEEALEIIVEKLKFIKSEFGAESLAMHTGQSGVAMQFTDYAERFCTLYETPNFSTAGSHCHTSKEIANRVTVGALPNADYKNSKCIILWGYNPLSSSPPQMIYINEAIKKGAKLIVIDPQETKLAKRADIHLKLRPGTDGALALGLIHLIIKDKLYDIEFVEKWTVGFDKLVDLVRDYTPDYVSKITEVSSELIIETAKLYIKNKPANISPGIAIELQSNGFQSARAISILQAITGNIDINGGAIINRPMPLSNVVINNKEILEKKPIGSKEYPLFYQLNGRAQANIFSDAILYEKPYPLKAMIVIGSNPILTWPDANKLREAFKSLDFLVVMDNFMTETAKLADLIIPGTHYIERNEIWNETMRFGKELMGLSKKIINSNVVTEWQFLSELAKALGYSEEFVWEKEEDAIDYRLKPTKKTFREMLNIDYGYEYGPYESKKYERYGFNTPSKKVEIYSDYLENLGLDPLPTYKEPAESPISCKDLVKEYPLTLSTGARNVQYYHSRFRNIKPINDYNAQSLPKVRMNKRTARDYKVKDGETVIVESLRGSIKINVCITEDVANNSIFIPHGWDMANSNELTDNKCLDPVTGFPPDRALLARIKKIDK